MTAWKRKEVFGDATLYLGDCLEVMAGLPDGGVDAVVTDPPYGKSVSLEWGGMWKGERILNDDSCAVRDAALAAIQSVPFAVFATPRLPPPLGSVASVCWDKGNHTGLGNLKLPWKPNFELVHVGGQGWSAPHRGSGVVKANAVAGCVGNRNDGHRWHPFEKPVEIMEHFVSRAPGLTILDPFMGSGTTGVACMNLGRKFIGIEIEEKYFDIACRRIDLAARQERLAFGD